MFACALLNSGGGGESERVAVSVSFELGGREV